MVDTVLYFEGESDGRLRLLRAVKNSFGAVNELGVFDLDRRGLKEVSNPSAIFLNRAQEEVPGSVVMATWEGTRPMLVEVQALVAKASQERPRRTTSGVDGSRLAMVLAVLQQHCDIKLGGHDVFASTVGGAKLNEPAADLALAIALASLTPPLDRRRLGVVAMGEIGLSGELRRVRDVRQRLAEAARLGFELASCRPSPGVDRAPTARSTRCGSSRRPMSAPRSGCSTSIGRSGSWRAGNQRITARRADVEALGLRSTG